jgi:hypothetical protein
MAKHYGGVSADSDDKGKAAYKTLLTGGSAGFNAVLGGGRSNFPRASMKYFAGDGRSK